MILGNEREMLRALLRARSVRTGEFVLASGATSSYYIDARLTTMSGSGQLLIGRRGLAEIDERAWSFAHGRVDRARGNGRAASRHC